MDTERIPVIIGAGEVTERPADPLEAREPAALMAEALHRAAADAGAPDLLPALDSLDIVNSVSWPYADLPAALAGFLGFRPRRLVYGPVGGESPVRYLHEAANRIARGESAVAAVVGAEATHAVAQAQKRGITLPWTTPDPNWTRTRGRDFLHPLAVRLGVADPATAYPFYENAFEAHLGQTPAEGAGGIGRAVVRLLRRRGAQSGGLAAARVLARGNRHAGPSQPPDRLSLH